MYEKGIERNFIPKFTEFEKNSVKTIYSGIKIRIMDALIENYGGSIKDWSKKVGKIQSNKYIFDLHWYEKKDMQYQMKVKVRKERK